MSVNLLQKLMEDGDLKAAEAFFLGAKRRENIENMTLAVRKVVDDFLLKELGTIPTYYLWVETALKLGWGFIIRSPHDTTSYVHDDLRIEWYGTMFKGTK